ncbi:NitT/TauT family transport system substrate-binding protein [Bradyrhizobium sp. AZCC 1577]
MKKLFGRLAATLLALTLTSGFAAAQSKVTIAIGGGACLCYLPTVLAKQLGEYEKAGVAVELVDLKGGSDALKAVLGGSADVVSGYFDHCVNLAAKKQELQSFVIYDRYPGLVLVVSPAHTSEIKSIKDLAGKKVGVSAPGSSTDFFLKYLLKKNGLDPTSAAVIGVGLGATAVAAMQQGQIDAAVMLDPSVTVLQGSHPDLKILADTRTQKDTLAVFGGEYPGGALYTTAAWINSHEKEVQALTNAIVNTLNWIHSHSPEEIMAKMPEGMVGKDKALYLAALKKHDPDVLANRFDGPEGRRRSARRLQRRLARGGESQYRRDQDVYQQICRAGQEDHGRQSEVRG